MMRLARCLLVALAAVSIQGCGDASNANTHGAGGSGSGSGGHGGVAAGGAPSPEQCVGACKDTAVRPTSLPPPKCPLSEPAAGSACTEADLQCSYGDAPTPRCRRYYRCEAGAWALEPSDAYPCVENQKCPAAVPKAGSECIIEVPGLPCAYEGLLCFCEAGADPAPNSPGYFGCYGAPMNPACPALLPNIGEGCGTQALECHYASNGCTAPPNSTVFCREGAWEEGQELLCYGK